MELVSQHHIMAHHVCHWKYDLKKNIESTADGITQVYKLYLQRSFKITHMHTYCEFGPLRKEMTALTNNLNCASKKEHVPEIERFIRTVKERVRSAWATMTFKQISKFMIVHLVASAIFWLNVFLPSTTDTGLSDKKVTGQLILVITVDYKKVCCPQPGKYVQVHQEYEPQNTIAINRTIGAITLWPQYKLQGGYFFESLLTGKCLRRSH